MARRARSSPQLKLYRLPYIFLLVVNKTGMITKVHRSSTVFMSQVESPLEDNISGDDITTLLWSCSLSSMHFRSIEWWQREGKQKFAQWGLQELHSQDLGREKRGSTLQFAFTLECNDSLQASGLGFWNQRWGRSPKNWSRPKVKIKNLI